MSNAPTVESMRDVIGRHGFITLSNITVRVLIHDVRWVFGRYELLVEGEAGTGKRWVQAAGFTPEKVESKA